MDASIIRYKAINNDGIVSALAQSVALVCKQYLSKALIQFPRKIEDSAIAHLTPYFEFLALHHKMQYCGHFLHQSALLIGYVHHTQAVKKLQIRT